MSDNHFTDKTERFTFIPDVDGSGYILRSVHTEDTEIDVPASYNGKPVTAIGEKAFYDRKDITRVTLPDSIKKIGSSAFYGCGIEKLELPPDLEYIGDRAFMKCNELIEVEINSVIKSIGSSAFEACHGLHYVGMRDIHR